MLRRICLNHIDHRIVPDLRGGDLVRLKRMGVNRERDIRVGVTQPLSHRGDWCDARQPRLTGEFRNSHADLVRPVVLALWPTEHQIVADIIGAVRAEYREREAASACWRARGAMALSYSGTPPLLLRS